METTLAYLVDTMTSEFNNVKEMMNDNIRRKKESGTKNKQL